MSSVQDEALWLQSTLAFSVSETSAIPNCVWIRLLTQIIPIHLLGLQPILAIYNGESGPGEFGVPYNNLVASRTVEQS